MREGLLAGSNFQMAFSNSVIEHVGDREYQAAFAKVVQRLSEKYFVQTPSKLFPIEAHNGIPFWWYYPGWLKRYFLEGWSKKLPKWTEMVEGTRVLSKKDMTELFPDSRMIVEKFFGFPKSYTAYKI